MHHAPNVVVVMATYNGVSFLRQQVESILGGELKPAAIYFGDDGSTDGTVPLLEKLVETSPLPFHIMANKDRLGPAGNFLSLLQCVPKDTDYLAFADQDDVWEPDKLARALISLRTLDPGQPALYCSRQQLVDERGAFVKLSPDFARPPSFHNALVQNIVTGCTTVLNKAALDLVRRAGVPDVPLHDWWIYLLVSGNEGQIVFDKAARIRYRQHDRNVTGGPLSHWADFKRRAKKQLDGSSALVMERNMRALIANIDLLTPANQEALQMFAEARTGGLFRRLRFLVHSPFYRQTTLDNLIMGTFFALGRL